VSAEFTLIVESHAKNRVTARIAEVPEIAVEASSVAAARNKAARSLRLHFDRQRRQALAAASTATVDSSRRNAAGEEETPCEAETAARRVDPEGALEAGQDRSHSD